MMHSVMTNQIIIFKSVNENLTTKSVSIFFVRPRYNSALFITAMKKYREIEVTMTWYGSPPLTLISEILLLVNHRNLIWPQTHT